jgi:ankyrin repeat protein
MSAHPAPETTPEGKVASDYSTHLRAAIAGASSTIQVVQQALVRNQGAKEDMHPPYEAFFRACQNGDVGALSSLLSSVDVNHRASPGVTGLHLAASKGHTQVVRLLLDNGVDIDPRLGLLNCSYGYQLAGATPLILAVANRSNDVVQLLLARGADRTATTDKGFSGQGIIELLQRLRQNAINLHIT